MEIAQSIIYAVPGLTAAGLAVLPLYTLGAGMSFLSHKRRNCAVCSEHKATIFLAHIKEV
jgi:hypothetical protein